jgi:transposase InsO family protein
MAIWKGIERKKDGFAGEEVGWFMTEPSCEEAILRCSQQAMKTPEVRKDLKITE